MPRKEVLASQIGNDAPFGTAVLQIIVRRYMISHDQNAEQLAGKSSLNLYYRENGQKKIQL